MLHLQYYTQQTPNQKVYFRMFVVGLSEFGMNELWRYICDLYSRTHGFYGQQFARQQTAYEAVFIVFYVM